MQEERADAQAALEERGLVVQQKNDFSDTVAKGNVISTTPAAGMTVPKGTTVIMLVSKGPQTFPMPDVTGMSRAQAISTLEGMGLIVEVVQLPSGSPPDTVVFQDPSRGTTVQQGQHVTIYVTPAH